MSATLSVSSDRVLVQVQGELGYSVWQTLRDARETAVKAAIPLHIDISDCSHGDMAGLGAVLLAQAHLPTVAISGCHAAFIDCFSSFGVCKQCATTCGMPPTCPRHGR